MKIDVTIASIRRPDLLGRTLESFSNKVFCHFQIGKVFVNIDPLFGDDQDEAECVELLRSHFEDPQIFLPEKCSFGLAVKQLWGKVESPCVLHMEDDWIVKEDIYPDQVFPRLKNDLKVVIPLCKEFNWKGGDPVIMKKTGYRKRFLGIPFRSERMGYFGTSPRFLDGNFAREVSALMNPDLDPEKQQRPQPLINPDLVEYLKNYRSILLTGAKDSCLIEDIGREWRKERGIEKRYTSSGAAVWACDGNRDEKLYR